MLMGRLLAFLPPYDISTLTIHSLPRTQVPMSAHNAKLYPLGRLRNADVRHEYGVVGEAMLTRELDAAIVYYVTSSSHLA